MARAIDDLPLPASRTMSEMLRRWPVVRVGGWIAAIVAVLALFARIMTYPLRHDEQLYLPAGILFSPSGLYPELGYNHLPNFPIILSGVLAVTGTADSLLVGRLLIFASWIGAAAALYLIARRATHSLWFSAALVILLILNPILLGPAGMIVSNNFIPVPFALFGLYLFILGAEETRARPLLLVASGALIAIAVGIKVNYIFLIPPFAIAALLVPTAMPLGRRLQTVTLPFLLGGLIGGAPLLAYLATDATGFLTHVMAYHREPHVAYWLANATLDGDKVMSLGGKAMLAYQLWLSGATMLVPLLLLTLLCGAALGGGLSRLRRIFDWKVTLTAALTALAVILSFVPTPAFPQYYTLPIPFALALCALVYGRIEQAEQQSVRPLVAASMLIALVAGAPMLAPALRDLARPGAWTGVRVEAIADRIRIEVRGAGGSGAVATLSPIFVLEADLPIEPGLAAGPFVYRVGEMLPADHRSHYARIVSPLTIQRDLAMNPPSGILVGQEGDLDRPLEDFARANGYARSFTADVGRGERITLYVAPQTGSAPRAPAHP